MRSDPRQTSPRLVSNLPSVEKRASCSAIDEGCSKAMKIQPVKLSNRFLWRNPVTYEELTHILIMAILMLSANVILILCFPPGVNGASQRCISSLSIKCNNAISHPSHLLLAGTNTQSRKLLRRVTFYLVRKTPSTRLVTILGSLPYSGRMLISGGSAEIWKIDHNFAYLAK